MATPEKNTDAVYDASTLGTPKMLVLGLQHLFAMFGATVLVPAITGLNVSTTCLLYTSPSPRDVEESRMPSSA